MKHLPFALLFAFVAACGSTSTLPVDGVGAPDADGAQDARVGADTGPDTGAAGDDAAPLPADTGTAGDDATPPGDSGFPVRRLACVPTSQLAGDLPKNVYGAVEAELVAITPPNTHTACPNDSGHVHLQLDVTGKRYDVAVNVESTTGAEMAIFT